MHNIRKLFSFCCLIFILFMLTRCEDPMEIEPVSPYAEIEKSIRSIYDSYAVFTWDDYTELLTTLSDDKFLVLPLNEMRNTYNDSKVVVGFRHDIDWNPFKALEMVKMEGDHGITATYFILATSAYYGHFDSTGVVRNSGMEYLYKELSETGAEIGIHNDLLTVMIEHKLDPFLFNKEELTFYRSLDIPIYGTASHGSPIARATVTNYQIFSDFAKQDSVKYMGVKYPIGEHSLAEYGFEYEAYFLDFDYYFSESSGKWNDPEGFSGIIKKLKNSQPGDRIEILTHPEWWGRKN